MTASRGKQIQPTIEHDHSTGGVRLFAGADLQPSPAHAAMSDTARVCLPAPPPDMVRAARAYLAPRYATGVDEVLWDLMERPLSDDAAIDAVIAASDRAQRGVVDQLPLMEV